MTRAIKNYAGDFLALVGLVALALGIVGYIVFNQDARPNIPLIEDKPTQLEAEFSDAQAVTPGQGQSVRVAGVQIGKISKVELEDGVAVVTMDIEKEHEKLIHKDASALLRPRTGLKDMFIELDPGTVSEPIMGEDDRIGVQNTAPDVDPDEILSALDTDTRSYLQLLINGLGKGLKGNGDDLREIFRLFEPLHRDLARVQGAFAERRVGLARLIHNYGSLTTELADKDEDLTRLVDASSEVFAAFAAEDDNISESIRRLPPALQQTEETLTKVDTLGGVLGPSLESLRPAFRQLDETNGQVLAVAPESTRIVRDEIRPFVRIADDYVRDLKPAARGLSRAIPDLTASFGELNRLFNIFAFNPKNAPGSHPGDRDNYFYWLAWAAQNGTSLHSTSDASGVLRRVNFSVSCDTFRELAGGAGQTLAGVNPAVSAPVVGTITGLLSATVCPPNAGTGKEQAEKEGAPGEDPAEEGAGEGDATAGDAPAAEAPAPTPEGTPAPEGPPAP